MTDYIFVLGKNWILSLAELIALLDNRGITAHVTDLSRHVAILDMSELPEHEVMEIQSALGGCFKVGVVIHTEEKRAVERAYPRDRRPRKTERKRVLSCQWCPQVWPAPDGQRVEFAVSVYPASNDDTIHAVRLARALSEAVKDWLLEAGAKRAAYHLYTQPDRRHPTKTPTALWPQTIARHRLLSPPNAEILVGITDTKMYVGKTLSAYDSLLQQYRDEARPYVSAEITTSPKLCRTLLNLAGARPGDTILDPFCGTGTILMEAALLGMRAVGIDIDGDAVRGARSNLKWLGRELGEQIVFKVIRGDARKLPQLIDETVHAIATEPPLGPVFATPPALNEAQQTIAELTSLYRDVLRAAGDVLHENGRVAMTLPVVVVGDKTVSVDVDSMLEGTPFITYRMLPKQALRPLLRKRGGLTIHPERTRLPERKRGQIVQREVVVLGRP